MFEKKGKGASYRVPVPRCQARGSWHRGTGILEMKKQLAIITYGWLLNTWSGLGR